MNTTDLIQDAHMMLETIKMCKSPSVRQAAACQLADIAAQLQAAVSMPEPAEPKPDEEPPAMIDLAFKYRTRDGREVTELKDDGEDNWPLSGYIKGIDGKSLWTREGKFFGASIEHPEDLIPTGELA